jgi:hypothetical protein
MNPNFAALPARERRDYFLPFLAAGFLAVFFAAFFVAFFID